MADSISLNMNDWAAGLKLRVINPELTRALGEKKTTGFNNVEKLGLPRFKNEEAPLREFLKQPHNYLSKASSEEFYIVLSPKNSGLKRYSKSGINAEQVLVLIRDHIESDQIENYDITWQACYENVYGGTIVINSSNQIFVEFRKGKQAKIAKGTDTPRYFAIRNGFSETFKYSFVDKTLRLSVYNLILAIPHCGENRKMRFTPGYYEFTLIRRNKESPLEPIFFDYRDDPVFHLPETIPTELLLQQDYIK